MALLESEPIVNSSPSSSNQLSARVCLRLLGKSVFLAVAMVAVWFSAACSSTTEKQTPGSTGSPQSGGGFTNASLKGSYAYKLGGNYFNLSAGNGPFERAGTFVADGKGNITGGMDDFDQGSTLSSNPVQGIYAISGDGTGKLSLNLGSSQIQ